MNYLIVGGSSGIGKSIVHTLLNKGHECYVLARERRDLPEVAQLHFLSHDILDGPFPTDFLPDDLAGLAYCPGSINLKPFRSLKEDQFLADFKINLLGAVTSIQSSLKSLKAGEDGSPSASILLFSTVAVTTGMPFHASISSAKGAVEGLTRSLAAELAPKIRVNCIAPSITDTPLAGKLLSSAEKIEASAKRHPLQMIGKPSGISSSAVHLLSPDSSWITGQVLHIDGGLSVIKT